MKRNQQSVKAAREEENARKGRSVKQKFEDEIRHPVQAKNAVQKEMLAALANYEVVVFNAPAGVGKTFLAISEVSDWLKKGYIDKIVLTRANVSMGKSAGSLPGTAREKYEPFLMPMLEVMWERYGKGWYETALSSGNIELLLPEYARGRSIRGVLIVDEAQSMEPDHLYTLITRIEDGGKLILIGDPTQSDIRGKNGIDWLCTFVEDHPELQERVKVVKATSDDIVRGGLCKAVVKAKEKEKK